MKVVNLTQLVHMLSDMLDLVGIDDLHHSKRVAYMCLETGRIFGFEANHIQNLYHAALLHDCGVSNTSTHHHIIKEMDWPGAPEHCARGSTLLGNLPLFRPISTIILLHHTHWEELDPGFTEWVALSGNLIHLCDRADALIQQASSKPWLSIRDSVRDKLKRYRGSWFNPELMDAFLDISRTESFWLQMQPHHLREYMAEREMADPQSMISTNRMHQVAELAAEIVDTKSHYTARHSQGVARFSSHVAKKAGFDREMCSQIGIAGLLHDVGKMRVPDSILEKPASLSFSEKAYHHETLAGDGYPFHLTEAELDIPARIIAIADIFQAMTQERPYRPAKEPEVIITALQTRATQHKVDPDLVQLVIDDFESCMQIADLR
jgi:HD-GYP domain-containing protein (c-di-GMP phosphodiesterase class II)